MITSSDAFQWIKKGSRNFDNVTEHLVGANETRKYKLFLAEGMRRGLRYDGGRHGLTQPRIVVEMGAMMELSWKVNQFSCI